MILITLPVIVANHRIKILSECFFIEGIEKALCSCPDPASKLGKCKHVVGLLLWCKREEGGSLPVGFQCLMSRQSTKF